MVSGGSNGIFMLQQAVIFFWHGCIISQLDWRLYSCTELRWDKYTTNSIILSAGTEWTWEKFRMVLATMELGNTSWFMFPFPFLVSQYIVHQHSSMWKCKQGRRWWWKIKRGKEKRRKKEEKRKKRPQIIINEKKRKWKRPRIRSGECSTSGERMRSPDVAVILSNKRKQNKEIVIKKTKQNN